MKTQLTIPHNTSRTCATSEPVSGRQPVLALLMRLLWAAALVPPAFGTQAAVVLTTLHSFQVFPNGENPSLVQASDGNFYGTTSSGGTNAWGTIFRMSPTGALTNLFSFNGSDGAVPSGLVQGSDGNFYGTTESGGHTNLNDGYGCGTVFRISPNGAVTTLYVFGSITNASGEALDGANPQAALVQGSDGNFYGTTQYGGNTNEFSYGCGTVFQITPNGALTSLYSFTLGNDGRQPSAALVQGSDGNFYGATSSGGNADDYNPTGFGSVFKISTNGALTTLYSFGSVQDTNGFPLDGENPVAALVRGSDGSFYGTTRGGGTDGGNGTVFKITPNGALTSLYSFTSTKDGAEPWAGLVQGSDGNFYGTTTGGGKNGLDYGGYGTVFKISTNGALTTLYSFGSVQDTNGFPLDGSNAQAGLVQGRDGNFYGTTSATFSGVISGYGTVFKISTNGVLTTLYSFTGGDDGLGPNGLVQGSDGSFYGTARDTVFKINTNGALTTLHYFSGGNNGDTAQAGLVQGSDGNFYGTTYYGGTKQHGTVFKISPTGAYATLYSFGGNDGQNPSSALVQGSDGNFYGTTLSGGTNEGGSVFKITPTGSLTSLYSFSGTDGADPGAELVQGSDGNFYGTTWYGGTYPNWGTVFKISATGALTSLYSFTGHNDGGWPFAALVQGSDGSFYGTTQVGGVGDAGTVFRLTIVPEPQLTIIPSAPYVILTWPTDYAGFSYAGYTLQSTTNLGSSAVWTTNSPGPVVIGGQNVVINTISGTQRFFRLSQ
jgi:uncharacterized repeat protein (TIGR03803 family)